MERSFFTKPVEMALIQKICGISAKSIRRKFLSSRKISIKSLGVIVQKNRRKLIEIMF
jgi:hypothetical protein